MSRPAFFPTNQAKVYLGFHLLYSILDWDIEKGSVQVVQTGRNSLHRRDKSPDG